MIIRLMKTSVLFPLIIAWLALGATALRAIPGLPQPAQVELIAESSTVQSVQTFYVALDFKLEPHWHIYWKNPGASGLPVEIEWELPAGFTAGEIEWPAPERIELGGLMNYGYEDAATLMVPIRAAEDLIEGEPVMLQAKVAWLMCEEVCVPGDASLRLELVVGRAADLSEDAALFAAARARLPQAALPWEVSAANEDGLLVLTIEQGAGPEVPKELYFYADKAGVIDPSAAQRVTNPAQGVTRLEAVLDPALKDGAIDDLAGVLQSAAGNWQIDLAAGGEPSVPTLDLVSEVPVADGLEGLLLTLGLPGWLLLAFLGGLILNVMPCVLPVLSLKVFSLLKHSGQSRAQALLHGAAYTAGVVVSFLALAAVLLALRAVGERIGWGFQLQSPNFVVVLTMVFYLFALNLLGVFEVGTSLVGADTEVSKRNDALGSFGMGVLAAVVGAPCMGPLVASVSGIAVQADAITGLLIFGVMGLGLASPFLFLSVFPKLVAYLHKPGVWMESVKQFMGFLLMAAVVFLALVAGRLGGVDAVIALLIALLVVGIAAWVYGRW